MSTPKLKKFRQFETVPLAKVPQSAETIPAVQKLATKEEPYAVPVVNEEVRSLKRKPGH